MKIFHALNTFPSNPGFSRYLSLIGKKADPVEVFMAVYAEVVAILLTLKRGLRYSCEDLCVRDLWSRYPSKGLHRALGIALKHLVNVGALPLECVTPNWNNKYYTPKEAGDSCCANSLTIGHQPSLSDKPESTTLQEV